MKIYISNFRTKPMDINANLAQAMAQLECCISSGCDVFVLPCGCLLGAKAGVLDNACWLEKCYSERLMQIVSKAQQHGIAVVTDSLEGGVFAPYMAGNLPAQTSSFVAQNSGEFFENAAEICKNNHFVFINWMEKGVAGQKSVWIETLTTLSKKYGTTFVLGSAGFGYSTHPDFYMPMVGVVADGKAEVYRNFDGIASAKQIFDVDVPVLKSAEEDSTDYGSMASFPVCYSTNPLIPANVSEKEYCLDLFDMQCEALANRLANIKCKSIVLSLSGGLDSTMALLVAARAFDMLGLDKSGMHIVTQPGFGTSGTTKGLAYDLCEGLGLPLRQIDITDTCRAALLSIGHDGVTPDVTFENVQARIRTVNALNLANHTGAIMVGTGDLSEVALGFSTFGGDQIASYNVNSCVSKTVMRTMLPYVVEMEMFSGVKQAVYNVLNIPVSPELVPHGGEILQKTEDILAPYKLIDFFIYCTVVTKIAPSQIVKKAYEVFDGEFTTEYITEKLKMFYWKFSVGQFKRSCAPECADLTHPSLVGREKTFPSDGSALLYIQDMEQM